MRAIIIDAEKQEIREETCTGNTLEFMQKAVGGLIEPAFVIYWKTSSGPEDYLYVNEEGLLSQPKHFFVIDGVNQPFAGNGVVMGLNSEGETVGAEISLEKVKKMVRFKTLKYESVPRGSRNLS